ncbi:hydroxymethylbilane synthase [Deferribacterales bacterium RsTz2092]|nr:porphobilinogen deaminase [Deferribacterales bacterium]
MINNSIVIATRGSQLALWQANHVKSLIESHYPDYKVTIKVMKTTGDRILDRPLADIGGKGLFVKEIEQAIISHEADIAVHSMKDVPILLADGLEICTVLVRQLPNDAFLSLKYNSIDELQNGAVVGTSSLRRKLQLLAIKPNLSIKDLRGNVDTRIRKLESGEYDAIILAQAGLNRLGLTEHIKETISTDTILPAACQGALGVEARSDDKQMLELLAPLKSPEAELTTIAERAFLIKLNGGCQVPIACYANITNGKMCVAGYLASLDAKLVIKREVSGRASDAGQLGDELANMVLADGGDKLLMGLNG